MNTSRSPRNLACFVTALCGLALLAAPSVAQPPSLAEACRGKFLVGAALNAGQFTGRDAVGAELVRRQFNSITPENAMKWDALQPEPGRFRFETADRFVEFGRANGMFIVGHTLVWHSQTPHWVFRDRDGKPASRELLLERMRNHIRTVVGRYKGRVNGWDVVNEALAEDGTLRDSPWRRIIGDDYIAKAFEFAHEADPQAALYYNDYGIEDGRKRAGTVALIRKLRAQGVPITGVGMQQHVNLEWPAPAVVGEAIEAFAALGVKVMVTELDVDVLPSRWHRIDADVGRSEGGEAALNPYPEGLPAEKQQALARRYAGLFRVYLAHAGALTRVTFWGLSDADSWLDDFPIRGRTNHPLLFDRARNPKPAHQAVIDAIAGKEPLRE
jgi:endo-1,4-beta-xylanase